MFNGFLFHGLSWETIMMWIGVTLALIVANELSRKHKWVALFFFVALPIILPFVLWIPHTATPGSGASTGTWFHWVKVYSAVAGCLGFMLIRYWDTSGRQNVAEGETPYGTKAPKALLFFPPLILAVNILEACIRDFQVYGMHATGQVIDGVVMISGPWNIMNGIAGILNILAISGWVGIKISKKESRDMLWPDMMWFWIIAYDLWNFAYVYNCVSDHAFYAGAALLVACTIPAFFIRRGAWLQHRAHTLALWMMFTMSVPMFVDSPRWGVPASHDPKALFAVSFLSLIVNIAVTAYHFLTIAKDKRNPFRQEVYKL
ncbi:MAG: DUF5692 family protein [Bacteroidales bacterium]|nr:DUF5692 family protein [Bacteroidales bacterium]